MKILFISKSNSPNKKIVEDFKELGHDSEIFLCRPYSRGELRRRLTEKLPGYTYLTKKISKEFVNRKLESRISEFQPDLIIGDKAEMIYPETLEGVESRKILWFPDDPQFHRLGKKLSKGYDRVLTNSKCVLESYDIDAELFPFHMLDEQYYGAREKIYDVCFVGRHDEKRERYMKVAAEEFENVIIGGPGWDRNIDGAEVRKGWLSREEMIRIYEESKIVINLAKTREHFTQRIFEAGATESVVLSERLSGLRDFYSEEEIPEFETPEEMIEKISHILDRNLEESYSRKSKGRTKDEYRRKDIAEGILEC
jgi:hypothetical protein